MNLSSLALGQDRSRLLPHAVALLELTKPRIALLELLTVWVAACVACSGIPSNWMLIVNALIGTALVAASASTLNQWLERSADAQMERTANRPLPSGEVSDREALLLGLVSFAVGTIYLAVLVHWATAILGLVTWALYVCVYTPLKKRTSANTVVGAVAGALPVLMGASAVLSDGGTRGGLLLSLILFGIVFFWQFPHFMAIAWIYRDDYRRAGFKMLTVTEPTGRVAGLQAVTSAAMLLPLSVLPAVMMKAGPFYLVLAMTLSLLQLATAIDFLFRPTDRSARRMLWMSLIFLPAVFGMLWLSPFIFPWL